MKRAKRSDIVSYSRPRSLPLPSLPPFSTRNRDERRQLAVRVRGNCQVVERVAHQIEAARPVQRHENRRLRAVFVGRRHIDENLPLLADRLLRDRAWNRRRGKILLSASRIENSKDFPFGIALVGQIGIDLVVGANDMVAVAFFSGRLGVALVRLAPAGTPVLSAKQTRHALHNATVGLSATF